MKVHVGRVENFSPQFFSKASAPLIMAMNRPNSGACRLNSVRIVRTVQTNASPGSHYQESALSGAHVQIARTALGEVLVWFATSAAGCGPDRAEKEPDSRPGN